MAQKGRPRKKVDPDTVFQLACIGASISQIADHFRVSHDTIERRFGKSSNKARAPVSSRLLQSFTNAQWAAKRELAAPEAASHRTDGYRG
jgi:hypothetical protein